MNYQKVDSEIYSYRDNCMQGYSRTLISGGQMLFGFTGMWNVLICEELLKLKEIKSGKIDEKRTREEESR